MMGTLAHLGLAESNTHLFTPTLALTPSVVMAKMLTATPWSLETCFAETQSQRTQLRLWTSEGHLCQEGKPGRHPLSLFLCCVYRQSSIPCIKEHEEIIQDAHRSLGT